jgi:hypothetical protein
MLECASLLHTNAITVVWLQGILTEREGLSVIDLLVLTSSDELGVIMKKIFFVFIKQAILTRRSASVILLLLVIVPCTLGDYL